MNDVPNPPTTIIIENHLFGETEEIRPRVYRVIDLNPFEEIWTYQLYDQQENKLIFHDFCEVNYTDSNYNCIKDYNCREKINDNKHFDDNSEINGCSTSLTPDRTSLIVVIAMFLIAYTTTFISRKMKVRKIVDTTDI